MQIGCGRARVSLRFGLFCGENIENEVRNGGFNCRSFRAEEFRVGVIMEKFKELQSFMDEMTGSGKISGCCAAVYRKGKCEYRRFEGFSDLENQIPVSASTAFRLASMTKPVTATAVLLCRQKKLLDLGDAVSDYLPEFSEMYVAEKCGDGFVRGEKARSPITVAQLLSHSSGLGSGAAGDWQYDRFGPHGTDTLSDAVSRYGGMLLDFHPGTSQMYSPVVALDVAARIVEKVSGENYAEFIRKGIFQPLGMSDTSYLLEDYAEGTAAYSYVHENGTLKKDPLEHNFGDFPRGYTGGGAGLLSTLDDYSKFAEMLRKALSEDGPVLTRESVLQMKKPRLSETIEGISPFFNWGLGVRVIPNYSQHSVLSAGSFGWSGAYGSHFWVDEENALTAVYMHNSVTYGGAGAPHTFAFESAVMKGIESF